MSDLILNRELTGLDPNATVLTTRPRQVGGTALIVRTYSQAGVDEASVILQRADVVDLIAALARELTGPA